MEEFMKRILIATVLCVLFVYGLFAGGDRQVPGSSTSVNAVPGDGQPFGKFNPPIKVRSVLSFPYAFTFERGDTVDNNPWIKKNHDDLGMDIEWQWVTNSSEEGVQRMNATIASGDLPDIFPVNAQQFDMLAKNGQIWDLTDVITAYASPEFTKILDSAQKQMDICSIGGRVYAIPRFGHMTERSAIMVRQDWIDKLGLPNPDSIQNMVKIAEAFATRDPDGNGRNDTIGLLVNSDFWSGIGGLGDFFAGYHAYPDNWLPDNSGNIIPGVIQPEVKTALSALADMYKQGIIDREFTTVDWTRSIETVTSGRAGLFYGYFGACFNVMDIMTMDPQTRLMSYPIPSADSKPASFVVGNMIGTYYVVNKKFAHPEALVKAENLLFKTMADPTLTTYHTSPSGYQYFILNLIMNEIPEKNYAAWQKMQTAIPSGNTSSLNSEEKMYYDAIKRYLDNKDYTLTDWGYDRIFGASAGSSFGTIDHYVKNDLINMSPFTGAPTETMVSRGGNLDTLRDEVFTKIIMGSSPVSAFDTFVQDWKRQGGDAITKEVNDWYKANR
jgi:putative aldouronate transport system substrate-binding protein